MTLFLEFLGLLLVAFGLTCLIWMTVGRLLLPGACPVRAVITGEESGNGLEQTVKGLLWLRRTGLWRGVVVIEDGGLDRQGREVALALARQDGVELTWK